ncbi:MAG: hypothetical protein U5L09_09145 [Bacteroidales bacterium]|nr:hypothetical protein [Bacteroidales bacterium]
MITIRVDENTKAGRVLIETVRMMADKYSGIDIDYAEDEILEQRMKDNDQSDFLSEEEKAVFIDELRKLTE